MSRELAIIVHGIGKPGPNLPQGEHHFWLSEGHFESLIDKIMAHPRKDQIRITFDDGNASDYDIGFRLLQAHGLKAEFFVLTGRLNKPGFLSSDQITEMRDAGMTIGTHGVDHVDWRAADDATLHHEINGSCQTISEICGMPTTRAAVPFGSYNRRVIDALQRAGITRIYTSDQGYMTPGRLICPRHSLRGGMTVADFDRMLAGHLPAKRMLRRATGMIWRRFDTKQRAPFQTPTQ